MAVNIPEQFRYRYELIIRELTRPEDFELLDSQAIIDLLMHPDEVVVVSPANPGIVLEGAIDSYFVYDQSFQPVYQIASHRGMFGDNPLELIWLQSLLPMTIFYLRYPTHDGDRTIAVLRK